MNRIDDGRDKPLSFHWKVEYADLRKLLPILPAVASGRMERVLASIIADAMLVAAAAHSREECQRISYSPRKAFYGSSRRYFGTDYSYAFVVRAVDMLVELGVLGDHFKAKGGKFEKPMPGDPLRFQSSFLPGARLFGIELPDIVRRKGEAVRMKDADKNLVDYKETKRVRRERAFLDEVNRVIAAAEIQLDIPGAMKDGNLIRFPARQGRKSGYAVNTAMVFLYRVFNGGWSLGGRYYGGWWQSVPKEGRKAFRIDGAKVVEEDFSQIHPRLLYALAGEELGDRDAYTIPGYEEERNTLCKRGWNTLINAPTHQSALLSLSKELGIARSAAADLIRAIKAAHPKVAGYFHSGVGLKLQYFDSEISKTVLNEMTVKRGLVCLPVFDSFIVKEQDRDTLVLVMKDAFEKGLSTVRRNLGGARIIRQKGPHRAGGCARVRGSGTALAAGSFLGAGRDDSGYGSGSGDTFESFPSLSDGRYWASVEMDVFNGPQTEEEIEHCQDSATDTRDDLLPKPHRIQAQDISPASEGSETRTHETSILRGALEDDPSATLAKATMGPVTECVAQRVSVEAFMEANQVQDIHSPIGGSGKDQMAVRAAPALPLVSESLPVFNRRLPPAFILQAERQTADAYRAKVEASRLSRTGQRATSPLPE